jgi:hypothetical protein
LASAAGAPEIKNVEGLPKAAWLAATRFVDFYAFFTKPAEIYSAFLHRPS